MGLVNTSNVLYINIIISQKEKEVNWFKFILHNNNIKLTNTIELTKVITIYILFIKVILFLYHFKKG
jgi:hypothetical protein